MKNFQDEGVPESFEWEGDEMAPGSLTSLFTTENKKLTKFIESLVSQSLSKTLISSEVPLQSHSNFLIPDNPDLKTFIEELSESIPQSTLVVSPRQIGHMTSLLPAHTSTISSMITSLNQNMVKIETSASLTSLEKKVMENLAKEWGMDEGLVCSGGTVANLTALWMARENNPKPNGIVLGSDLLHYSFKKSCSILSLKLITIPTVNFQISLPLLTTTLTNLLESGHHITCLVGIAGTTETGSFDDLVGISKLGLKYGIHVHVDAAWGGPVTFSSHSHLLSGTFLSTSITVDGHKQFYTPLGCGMVFFKKGRGESIKTEAEYIIRKGSGDLGVKGLEGSRPAMILYLYANLKILGRKGLGKLIDMGIVRTREMYNRLRMFPGGVFECIHEPQSNILLYRYLPLKYRNSLIISKQDSEKVDWVNEQIQVLSKKSRDVDMIFTSRTRIIHKDLKITCLRVVISNPLTTFEIIEKGIRAQLRVAKVVERKFEVRELDLKWNGIEPVGFPWDI